MGILKIKLAGIYKITHSSGYYYIGKSVDIFSRWQSHYTSLKLKKHSSPSFLKLWNNSKIEDWTFEIIFYISKNDFKNNTSLKGKPLDKAFDKYLLAMEKTFMKKYSVNFALNKMNKSFS